jgi:predicted DNA-binding protein YlxM (UPF0122 family)
MPPKKRVDLPDHVRAAVLADVGVSYEQSVSADEAAKIRIFLATEQGLTTGEIAEQLNVSQQSVSRYSREGKEALARREQTRGQHAGEDPLRPGEREPVG